MTVFSAMWGFFVGAGLILATTGMAAVVAVGVVLLEPSLSPGFEAVAPWYVAISLGLTLVAGVVGALRAARD